jgi:hypothetical protein
MEYHMAIEPVTPADLDEQPLSYTALDFEVGLMPAEWRAEISERSAKRIAWLLGAVWGGGLLAGAIVSVTV